MKIKLTEKNVKRIPEPLRTILKKNNFNFGLFKHAYGSENYIERIKVGSKRYLPLDRKTAIKDYDLSEGYFNLAREYVKNASLGKAYDEAEWFDIKEEKPKAVSIKDWIHERKSKNKEFETIGSKPVINTAAQASLKMKEMILNGFINPIDVISPNISFDKALRAKWFRKEFEVIGSKEKTKGAYFQMCGRARRPQNTILDHIGVTTPAKANKLRSRPMIEFGDAFAVEVRKNFGRCDISYFKTIDERNDFIVKTLKENGYNTGLDELSFYFATKNFMNLVKPSSDVNTVRSIKTYCKKQYFVPPRKMTLEEANTYAKRLNSPLLYKSNDGFFYKTSNSYFAFHVNYENYGVFIKQKFVNLPYIQGDTYVTKDGEPWNE